MSQTNNLINNCGGSIITNIFVLTSADCIVNAKTIKIGLGSTFWSKPAKVLFSTVFAIHPNFNRQTLQNNVALIKLPEYLQFSPTLNAIRLVARSQVSQPFINAETYLTGFGFTSTSKIIIKLHK